MRPLVVGVLVLGACGSSHELPPDDSPPMIDAPAAGSDATPSDAAWSWQSLISNDWTMPMQDAGIRCSTLPITQEMWIDGFRPGTAMSPANDHQLLIVTANTTCSGTQPLGTDDELIYAVGLGSNGQLELPTGTAVHLVPSTTSTPLNLMLYDDIANETASTITGTSSIEVHLVDDPTTVAHDVDMVLGGDDLVAPANGQYVANGPCAPAVSTGYQWHLVALWPHMHESGTHATVTVGGTTVLDTAYSYLQEQTYVIPDTLVDTGAEVVVGCTIDNTYAQELTYGEVAPESEVFTGPPPYRNTVCWTGLYKYPTGTDPSGSPKGPEACVTGLE